MTNTSYSIGRMIAFNLHLDLNWVETVRLGDLFVEGFYVNNYVDLFYEQKRDSRHLILITEDFVKGREEVKPRIRGSSLYPPLPIERMIQEWKWVDDIPRYSSVIKGKTKKDTHIIRKNKDKTWIKSINKLQQMPWMVDGRLTNAIKAYEIQKPDSDNELLMLRYNSKVYEKNEIVCKAEMLVDTTFYQYLSADYRGRLYYEEPFLNFQGSDWARGLMKFAKGKRLLDNGGDYWLAVHTANSYNQSWNKDELPSYFQEDYKSYLDDQQLDSISLDKMTLDDRVTWVNNNINWIYEIADEMRIEDCEKPVSFLACCLEWRDFAEYGNDYISHLPIPVDGSNNGWQHLGAISKDKITGQLVGLVPTTIQADFYVQTAKKLYLLTTDERRKRLLEEMPMKDIRKGISKRGSMTRAYSAGWKKISENMWLDCRTEGFDETYGLTEEDCDGFAKDLIKAIDAVCPGPLDTMAYLQDLAQYQIGIRERYLDGQLAEKEYKTLRKKQGLLWKDYNEEKQKHKADSEEWAAANEEWKEQLKEESEELSILIDRFETRVTEGNGETSLSWNTPSGFPVEYGAFVMKPRKTIGTIATYTTYNKRGQVKHVGQEVTDNPDIQKYICGVAPNYIHSLDAAHMSLTISAWHGNFGAVHDSFATHACDVDDLIKVIKREFVEMYDVEDYFDRINFDLTCSSFKKYKPELGELAIREVYNSDYFFA